MISQNEIRNRARAFAVEWANETSEDAEAKSFWDAFFDVFGVSRRRVASFEYNVELKDGKTGFVDVLWKGVLLAEHKSKGKNLDKAYNQAKDYFPGLKDAELPRYIVVSDFSTIRLYDFDENTQVEFPLSELHDRIELFGFISGYEVQKYEIEEEASIKAAKLMAEFHNEIAKTGYSGHDLEVFLIRILFCLFADDTGIFPKRHFSNYIAQRTAEDGSDLGSKLLELFDVLNRDDGKRQTTLDEQLAAFPYVNGSIFSERIASISLDKNSRDTLLKCCAFDWSGISASIFGSLFQGVLEEKARRQLGAHYTSELNIMKVIEPLFLDELYNEFDTAKKSPKKLDEFHEKIASLKFLDPACGCGNFLVTSYKELRRLETQILLKKRKHSVQTLTAFGAEKLSLLHINQFYGIEIEEFPALVARTAMYLADHQANQELSKEFGLSYARIPLEEPATIVQANALSVDWETIVPKNELSYIFGNPPFYGARLMTKEQKSDIVALFPKKLKGVGNLDLVTGWYQKAAAYIRGTRIKCAFVSTNSICQGEQVAILWKYLSESFGIYRHFAHQTFRWSNDAPGVAAVYCVIIGFAVFDTKQKYLYTYETVKSEPREKEVGHINAYLTEGPEIFITPRSKPISTAPEIVYGNMPNDGGNFLFSLEEKNDFISREPNSEKFFREIMSAHEFLNGEKRFCLWLVDADPTELKSLPLVMERIENVRNTRLSSTREATRESAKTPTLFGYIKQPKTNYILIPRHSTEDRDYIPFDLCGPEKIVSDSCLAVKDASIYDFGILTSKMHNSWIKTVCGRIKSDIRYSNTLVYNNFPWPQAGLSEDIKNKISESAQNILDVRHEFPNASLADLYDPRTMPPKLQKVHATLDAVVDRAYQYHDTNIDTDRVAFLFKLYESL